MLTPKRVKHRKWRNRSTSSIESRGTTLTFGSFGLKALEAKWIPARQLEAARRVIIRYLRKGGKVWIRVFPDRPFTQKAAEVGMGSGKGDVAGYVMEVRPGRVLFEVDGVSEILSRESLRKAGTKLPMKVRIVAR